MPVRAGGLGAFGVCCLALLAGSLPAPASAAIVAFGSSLPAAPVDFDRQQTTWQYVLVLEQPSSMPGLQMAPSARELSPASAWLHAGAVFGLNSFAGYVAGSCTSPAGWTCSVRLPGMKPAAWAADLLDALPADGIVDLVWTYDGGPRVAGSAADVALGAFTAASWHSGQGLTDWSAMAGPVKVGAPTWAAGGQLAGPRAQDVREPASLALAGVALLLAAGVLRSARPRLREGHPGPR